MNREGSRRDQRQKSDLTAPVPSRSQMHPRGPGLARRPDRPRPGHPVPVGNGDEEMEHVRARAHAVVLDEGQAGRIGGSAPRPAGGSWSRARHRFAGHGRRITEAKKQSPVPGQQNVWTDIAVEGGFTLDDFTVNEQAGTVTCPNGSPTRHRWPSSGPDVDRAAVPPPEVKVDAQGSRVTRANQARVASRRSGRAPLR